MRVKVAWPVCSALPICAEFGYKVPVVVFLLDWIMATHLKLSFHHQSMRKWGVNTLVFIQHSFIFLPEAKKSSATEDCQMGRRKSGEAFREEQEIINGVSESLLYGISKMQGSFSLLRICEAQ